MTSVGILPLGTGNDLSRCLGWGPGYEGDIDGTTLLSIIKQAAPVKLDRWGVCIRSVRHLGITMPSRTLMMNNYLSVGVDALVTLNFHRTRESPFYIISSRLFNKVRHRHI